MSFTNHSHAHIIFIGLPYNGNGGSDSTSDCLSAGVAAGIAVALTLLLSLPVGVVIGCSGAWCIWRRGRGPTGQGTEVRMEQLQGAIYEVPDPEPVKTAIPLTDNQAYGQVKI